MSVASLSSSPLRVLVTGASGFTGRYACAALEDAGYRVVGWGKGLDADVDLTQKQQVLEAALMAQPHYVLHLAAKAFVAHDDVDEIYNINVLGTRNLLSALATLAHRPKHTVLASSANVYGNVEGNVDESFAVNPQNDYAVSKLSMEYMAKLWGGQLAMTIVRPFNYTGRGQDEKYLLPKIVSHFQRRSDFIELGNLDVIRDFNDVRNVVDTYVALLPMVGNGDVFNVCSGVETSLNDVVLTLESLSGHSLDVRVNPSFIRPNDVRRLVGDGGKLKKVIGAIAARPLKETLRWMLEAPNGDQDMREG